MEKLKCSSCGADIKVEDNKEYAICNHCGTKYKLNEDINFNIKLDDSVKDVLNNGLNTAKSVSKFVAIPAAIIIILAILTFVFIFSRIGKVVATNDKPSSSAWESNNSSNTKDIEDTIDNFFDKQEEKEQNSKAEQEKQSFNFQFFQVNGTQNDFFLKNRILDIIIQSNKTHDRLVSLVFEGKETTDEKEIIDIKHSLKGDYEVSLNYDDDGYINKVIVEKIN